MFAACFVVFWMATQGNLLALWSAKGAIMVVGGTGAVVLMAMPMSALKNAITYCKIYFFYVDKTPSEVIKVIGELADKARREGILSLEAETAKLTDTFLQSGLKMAIDGVAPDAIEVTLRLEVLAMQERHKAGKKFFDLIKVYGPGIALTATLIGQIGMFAQLGGSIEVMGQMLAVAVVATMYGTVMANCIAGPVGDKFALRSGTEILLKEMTLQGILSIQAGDNPRVTMDRMLAFVPSVSRAIYTKAA